MTAPALGDLSDALVAAAPTLDPEGRSIAGTLYRLLAKGQPVADTEIAAHTAIPIDRVAAALASWDGVYRDESDHIIGFWGLTITEMQPHRLQVDETQLYAWCAWDTLFLPATLNAEILVESKDANSGDTVTLTVTPDRVTKRSHEHMVVSFLLPNGPFTDDVIQSFCHYVNFFTDTQSARPWLDTHENTFAVPLDEAFELGQRWNAARQL
jgi:alkylmercury lyase